MMNTIKRHYCIFLACAVLAGFGPFFSRAAHAATLSISSGTISINTDGQSVNAIEAHLAFDPQEISVEAINTGGSVVNFWIQSPTVSNQNGTMDLSGIIPGGIVTANGVIVSFRVVSLRPGAIAQFNVVSARALLNDGKGTSAALSIVNPSFILAPLASSSSAPVDTLPPDPFLPQIGRSPDIFGGAYFVAFSATDPRAGIDHYEILEGSDTVWRNVTSPYRLEDQTLSSNIYIRAVNTAGNFRVVELPARNPRVKGAAALNWIDTVLGLIVLLLITIGAGWRVWKWKQNGR